MLAVVLCDFADASSVDLSVPVHMSVSGSVGGHGRAIHILVQSPVQYCIPTISSHFFFSFFSSEWQQVKSESYWDSVGHRL